MTELDRVVTIPAALRRAARLFPDTEAIVEGEVRITYPELLAGAEQIAAALIASGIDAGDRVALWAPNSAAWITASFGIYLAGAVLVPLNTRYKGEEAGHILRTAEARLLITVTDFLDTDYVALLDGVSGLDVLEQVVVLSGEVPSGAVGWNDFARHAGATSLGEVHQRESGLTADSLADIIFTSGTTGAPKGAMLTHGASVRTYVAWTERVGLRHGDRHLLVYPFFHTSGLKSGILSSVITGSTIVPHAVFDPKSVMQRVQDERITMLPGTPTVFQAILNDPDLGRYDLSSLRLSVTGAAVVPVSVVERMRDELKFETVVTGYGLTETTGTVSMARHDDPPRVVAETVGKPLPGVELRVVDDAGHDVPAGEQGEFLVRGFNVMRGYFNNPEATAETIDADGWLRTGDIGYLDDGGNLRITDRKKDMFIVGGFNAYPAEIEKIMLGHPDIAQVAVVGVPDERLGEVGVAFVIPRTGHDVDPKEVITWCEPRMANFKAPREVRVVDAFPLNPSGKVMKFRLRDDARR